MPIPQRFPALSAQPLGHTSRAKVDNSLIGFVGTRTAIDFRPVSAARLLAIAAQSLLNASCAEFLIVPALPLFTGSAKPFRAALQSLSTTARTHPIALS